MKYWLTLLSITACMFLISHPVTKAQAARHSNQPLNTARVLNSGQRQAAEQALARLQVLRDGWNDVNRQFINQNYVAARKLNSQEYEVQYLEAKTSVGKALQVLPRGELRTAIEQAMDIFDDLEAITEIFRKKSPLTTNVRVTEVFSYLKKYNVPYESGVTRENYGLMLHKDFVMSYILPLRYARVNHVEVLLGGKMQPMPPPPTYEQMFRVPPAPIRPNITAEELKEIVRQAIEARLHGDRSQMSALLDSRFTFYGLRGVELNEEEYLRSLAYDPSVKRFDLEQADLIFRQDVPILSTRVKYESPTSEFRSFKNTFTFVKRDGKWLISTWKAF
jgi:hypothetical protein